MKFRVTMKDPDTLQDAISSAVETDVLMADGLDSDERESVAEKRREKVAKLCSEWFKFGEYLTVEVDTEARTATVVSAKELW